MTTLQANEAAEMTAEISQTVMTEGEGESKRNDESKPTLDALETNSSHSMPDDKAVEDVKDREHSLLNESIEAEEKAADFSPDGRFLKFDSEIGRGSFKTVFKGLDSETGVAVAWCELQDKYSKSERSRFKEEAVMLKQLTHPNIVKFHEFFERQKAGQKDKRQLILVTELMTSGTLKTYLKRFKGVREKVLKSWCRQILEGLYFLHTRTPPIIHRDLKCDNIFVNGSTGLIKIGDLGLATLKKRSFAKSVIGTPEFMAPEMYEERYDESVDVYAFGMCMLEMVTLEYPYMECQNAAQIYKRVTQGIPPDCLAKVENSDIYDIIQGCTKYKKEERYTIPYLLKCPFFKTDGKIGKIDVGIKVDLVLPVEVHPDRPELVKLQLRLGDPKLRKDKHKDNEAIQFDFDLVKDNPDKISKELVSSGFIDANSMQLATKTIKDCVELVKRNREKGAMEEKENESVEKNHHPSESSHNVNTEEPGKNQAEETVVDQSQSHARSAAASQSQKQQGQISHQQQPQPTQQVQSQQPQQQQQQPTPPQQQQQLQLYQQPQLQQQKQQQSQQQQQAAQQQQQQLPKNEPENQEVRSRQNSTADEQPQQPAKAITSSVVSKDSGISTTSVASSVASEDSAGQRLEPLHVTTTSADTKSGQVSPDVEKVLPINSESSSTVSEKASSETVSMPSSSNSSTISLPGSQPASHTSTQQPAQQGQQQSTTQAPAQSVGKTKKKERAFKLALLTVSGDEIECSFDTYKNYRITFKFDMSDDESIDIAKSMIESGHLREANKALFVERLRRILTDARSKKDADSGTVRYEHQTSSESNPSSAHTLPTPTEKNEAFQFPAQPSVPKSEPSSQVHQANVQPTPTQGTQQQHSRDPPNEQEPSAPSNQQLAQPSQVSQAVNQQSSTQVRQQQAKVQVTQQTAQAVNPQPSEPLPQATNFQQSNNQQPTPQDAKSQPTQQVQPSQQNTQAVNLQSTQQVGQQPIPQTKQTIDPSSQQVKQTASAQSVRHSSQSTATQQSGQQSRQPVNNQTNQQATSTVDRQATVTNPQVSQTTTQVESQSSNQVNHQKTAPAKPKQEVENPPTSLPQPLSSQPQDATSKPATKTPTEVRGKKKQFQVQVLEEPKDGLVKDLGIVPVNTNVPQNPTLNTNVSEGTKVSPGQEVASPIQSSNQGTIAQQTFKSNTEAENSSQVTSDLPVKQLATEISGQTTVTHSQGANTNQAHIPAVAQTAIQGSPTQQRKPQTASTPRPASPAVSIVQQTQSVASQDPSNVVQQTVSVQTSVNEEQKIEASASTDTPVLPQENIHVQSPISNHPPIHIPIAPSEIPGENNASSQTANDVVSEKSHNTRENDKNTKHDDLVVQLTSSIQTQTSFDKNTITREQLKKTVERKAMEKSSSDEQPPGYDDSDGSVSSEKSYSRQSSDSHSAYDMDISSAAHKNISTSTVDIEHWLSQAAGMVEGDVEGSFANLHLSREETDELKRMCKKHEKERVEMQKRQTRELEEFYRKMEQKKTDKLPKDSRRTNVSTSTSTKITNTTTQTVHEYKSSNGHSVKTTTVKKQLNPSDENLTKLQQRSMQQFEFDVTKKKGVSSTMGSGWPANKHTFTQMKTQPTTAAMVLKGPRAVVATSSSSMPHIPHSAAGYIPHTSSSMVFASPQNNAMHSNLTGQIQPPGTGVYWSNGANPNWSANIDTGNGNQRGQQIAYSDWQTNGPYHPVSTQPALQQQQQMAQANNAPRPDGQMSTDSTKNVVLPSR